MLGDQAPYLGWVEPISRQQHCRGPPHDLGQPVVAGTVRQRRHNQAAILLRRARHQVGQVIGNNESHVAVRQDGELRLSRRPGGGDEPAGMVILHRRGRAVRPDMRGHHCIQVGRVKRPRAHPRHEGQARRGLGHRRRMVREFTPAQQRTGARRGGKIGDIVWEQAEVGRHPNGADPEAGPHRFQHEIAVLRLHENPVPIPDAMIGEDRGKGGDAGIELRPTPAPVAPNQRWAIRKPPGRLRHERSQVHDPAGHGQVGTGNHYRTRSSMET